MFARRLFCNRATAKLRYCYGLRNSSQQTNRNQELSNLEYRLTEHAKKREKREPFVKNLFIGQFDTEFLTFPEPKNHERYMEFMSWIEPVEEYMAQCAQATEKLNVDDVISHVRELGVLRATIGTEHGGLGCSETEVVKLTETLSSIPWLGTFFIKNHLLPVRLISKYATLEQKTKYLPGIATGEFIPTVCVTENHDKTSANSIKAHMTKSVTGNTRILNGEKNFVANATKANLFIVIANAVHNNVIAAESSMAIALVEGNQSGISCISTESTVGQQELPLCTVSFKNVEVPEENVISESGDEYNPLVDIFCPGRQAIGPQAVTILRSFLNTLTKYLLQAKHFDNNMCELEGVQHALARIAATLYTMESMVYYTAAIADEFQDQDLLAETTITELYCANQCIESILKGLKIVGAKAYLRTQPFIKYLDDALSLLTMDTSYIDSQAYVAYLGLQHAGKIMQEDIRKVRNKTKNSSFALLSLFKGPPSYISQLDIPGQLHQSFHVGANALEESIPVMAESVPMLFEKYGMRIIEKHEELCRLATIVTNIYASVAVLSRASRSYCIGLRHSNEERLLAVLLSLIAKNEISRVDSELFDMGRISHDDTFKHIVEQLYNQKGYFVSHALERIK